MTNAAAIKRIEKLETALIPPPKENCFLGASQEDFDRQIATYGPTDGKEIMEIWLIGVEPTHDIEA